MPKLIDDVRGRAIAEAREELLHEGYSALTIRRVAKQLEIGLGTIYNYFPSKEYLVASIMLEDWQSLTNAFEEKLPNMTSETVLPELFRLVRTFTLCYVPAWEAYEARNDSRSMYRQYHASLVEQLAGYIRGVFPKKQLESEPWLAAFLAEVLLRFGSDKDCEWENIQPAIEKLRKPMESNGLVP